jgi:oligosaccharide repeat unit polymerase
MKMIATEYGFAVINSAELDLRWRLLGLGLANLAGVAFLTPIVFIGKRGLESISEESADRSLTIGWGWLAAFLVFIVLSFGPSSLIRIFSFEALNELNAARGQERVGSSLSALFADAGLVCLIMYLRSMVAALPSIGKAGRGGLILFGFSMMYVLLAVSGSKYLALLPLVLFVLLLNMSRVREGEAWGFPRVVLLGAFGLLFLGGVGYLRGFGGIVDEHGYGVALQIFIQLINAFDAPDNLALILSRADDLWLGDLSFAPTLHYTFQVAVPRFLWADKPLIMGNLFIMERYIPERFSDHTGEVVSPSMPGEMLLSGGMVFMVLWSCLLGLLYALIYRYAHRTDHSLLPVLAYSWLSINVFNLLRSGTGIISPLIVFLLNAFIVLGGWQFAKRVLAAAVKPVGEGAEPDAGLLAEQKN